MALRFRALAGYGIAQVEAATMSLLLNRKYTSMPTVADFLEHLSGGSAEDRGMVEAGRTLEAIKRHGGKRSVVFDDPVTQAVIQQAYGGWVKLCETCGVEESEKWFLKNFAATWAAYKRQGMQVFGVLAGRHEIQNTANGLQGHVPPPRWSATRNRRRLCWKRASPTRRWTCGCINLRLGLKMPLASGSNLARTMQDGWDDLLEGKNTIKTSNRRTKHDDSFYPRAAVPAHGQQLLAARYFGETA